MRLITFEAGHGARLGALAGDDQAVDLAQAAEIRRIDRGGDLASMQALIDAGERGLDAVRAILANPPGESLMALTAISLRAPLPRPIRLRDCALFLQHMESGLDRMARQQAASAADPVKAYDELVATGKFSLNPLLKQEILYANCDNLAVSGPFDAIRWPSDSDWIDFELEWACVIGPSGRDIPAASARDHIFGFTIFNDWSARDTQFRQMAAGFGPGRGKDFEGSNTLGPWITTADEIADPYDLAMTCRVNGETWTTGTTATMHHRFDDAIVQFSRERVLHAGEVLGSGTVLGGCGFDLDRRLEFGDAVELEVEGIGVLRNRICRNQACR